MKLKKDFILREVAGDFIVIPTGDHCFDFGAVLSLNESGAFLWKQLQNATDEAALCDALVSEYGIDVQTAEADVKEFVALLDAHELLCRE